MNRVFERVHESIQMHTLTNGLRIYYIPKPGFSKTFAMLATRFGAVDASFTLKDGTRADTPAGVAHFLEHKMFEDEDGNALQKFALTGAAPNAFTSHNMTAYHFSCTEDFNKNLEILMRFVFTPFFTKDNVEKEKGIIGQEICMMEDNPFWQAYVGLYQGLYHEHPVRESIAGSIESISRITPSLLYQCHQAFYSPQNMVLVVCGTADFGTVKDIARRHSPAEAACAATRHYGTRHDKVFQSEVTRQMEVSQPYFMLGFKDAPVMAGESRLRRQLLGELCCRILAGETTPLYAALYQDRLINRQFSASYSLHPEAACARLGGESRDPQLVRQKTQAEVCRLASEGIDQMMFARHKRAAYGMMLRIFDDPDAICRAQAEAALNGEDFPDFADVYDTITAKDVRDMFARWARPQCTSISVILPYTEQE